MQERKQDEMLTELGSTAFAKVHFDALWGSPHRVDLHDEAALHKVMQRLAKEELATSMSDVSDGGLAVAIAKATFAHTVGASLHPAAGLLDTEATVFDLFAENASSILVTCPPTHMERIDRICEEAGFIFAQHIGDCVPAHVSFGVEEVEPIALADLRAAYSNTLESQLAAEVITA